MTGAIRLGFEVLGRVNPGAAAWCAERLFFTPPRGRTKGRMESFLASGRAFTVRTGQGRLAAWRWGTGPVVLLVHGWGGRGGQLSSFVEPLVASGFTAVAFDAPGHGRSGRGMSSLVDFARGLDAVVAVVGPARAAISHSLGGAAVTFALHRGLALERAVFVAPPARPVEWAEAFAARLGISEPAMARLRERVETRLHVRWSDLDLPSLASRLRTELLVIHDRGDAEVAWSDGALLAESWPGARLATTTGLGHRRILRDPYVVAGAVSFVSGRPMPALPLTEGARLEAELFDRSLR
jgi:pimeloyl-ACP methyl ester carboxylesterase